MTRHDVWKLCWIVLSTALLAGCDQLAERAGLPDPAKIEADGKAIGGACRNAGRGLEDCYRLNKESSKAAVFAGWKEMNEYMLKNSMQTIEPIIPPEFGLPLKKKKKAEDAAASGEKDADKDAAKAKKPGHDKTVGADAGKATTD
jgi:hypothetical protein